MEVAELTTKLGFHTEIGPLHKVEEKLDHLKEKLEFLGSVELVKGLYELAEKFAGMGEQIESAAVSAGLTTDEFQKLAFAAGQNAVGQDELSGALAKLNRQLYEAKDGSEEAQQAFESAGITPDQLAGFHNSTDALKALSDSFKRTSDPIKKQAIAMALLGRGSYKMVKFLNQGGEAIDKLGAQAEGMGAVLSGENVEQLAKFEDAMSAFWGLIKTVAAGIGAAFSPAIISAVHQLESLYSANQKLIQVKIKEWMYRVVYTLVYISTLFKLATRDVLAFAKAHPVLFENILRAGALLVGLSLGASAVSKALGIAKTIFVDFSNVIKVGKALWWPFGKVAQASLWLGTKAALWFQRALVGLLERLALMVVSSFPAVGEAIMAFSATLAATPIGLIVAGVAALIIGIHDLWTVFTGGKLEDTWIYKIWQMIKGLGGKVADLYYTVFRKDDIPDKERTADDLPDMSPAGFKEREEDKKGFFHRVGNFFSPYDGVRMRPGAPKGVAAVAEPTADVLAGASGIPASLTGAAASASTTINAPVTINVPPGTPPAAVGKAVQAGVKEHLDDQNRQALRAAQTARAY